MDYQDKPGDRLKKLRQILRRERDGRKYTQTEFGELFGASLTTEFNLENNNAIFTPAWVRAICDAFNVHEEWLLNGTEPIFRDTTEKTGVERINELYRELPPEMQDFIVDITERLHKAYFSLNQKKEVI